LNNSVVAIVGAIDSDIERSGRRTLWSGEDTSLRALLKCPVELCVEGSISHAAEVVVRLHIFLDGLTAVSRKAHVSESLA